MKIPKVLRFYCCILSSVLMVNLPHFAYAQPNVSGDGIFQMIPTEVVISSLNQAQVQAQMENFLSRAEVIDYLNEQGLNKEEVLRRTSALSELELKQLMSEVDQARAGGDVLMTILIVILIVFLARRI